jgi:integrase
MDESHLTLETLKPLDMQDFIKQMGKWTPQEGYVQMNTAALYKKFLLAFFASLRMKEQIKDLKNITREVKFVSHFKVDIPTEQILKLIEVTAKEDRELAFGFSLMAFDGLRPGEVLGLYFSDIIEESKIINLQRHEGERYFPKATKVGDPAVPIPLNDFSLELFTHILRSNEVNKRILPMSYKTFRKRFYKYVNEAQVEDKEGNKVTPHKLRHVFGHLWRNRGGDLQVLKEVMRHSDIRITMIYSAPSSGEVKSEFEQIINKGGV